ncbi:MAG: DNA repair protein RecO [Subdoligranulum sp.]
MQINTMGLVLRAVRVGEADQILTVLTPGNGVLSASARGSLRLKNKLFSACGLFCYSEFAITLGRKTNFIDSAAVSKVFHGLSKTVEGTALAALSFGADHHAGAGAAGIGGLPAPAAEHPVHDR